MAVENILVLGLTAAIVAPLTIAFGIWLHRRRQKRWYKPDESDLGFPS